MTNNSTHAGTALRVGVRSSRYLLGFVIATHAFALAVPWVLALPWQISAVVSVLVVASLLSQLRRHYWRGEKVLTLTNGRWQWRSGNSVAEVVPVRSYFVTPWLIVLPLGWEPPRRSLVKKLFPKTTVLVLLPDSADADELRRLRVVLNA